MHAIRTARTLLILGLPLCALLALSPPTAPVEAAAPPAAPSAGAPDDAGIARAQQYIAEREYQASVNAQGLQAPNRAQNLRSYFDGTGVRVHDRTAPGAPQLVGLSLAGVGRGETLTEAAPGEVAHDGARVEIRRAGLVEWYVNQEAGLEQGFTLETRSAGDGPLVLELAIDGATARAQGEDVVFATSAGRKLSFAKLAAQDAEGRALAARFEVASAGRLRYVVDDAGAAYPVVIDPLLSEVPDQTLQPNQASAQLGASVASAGDVNGDGYGDVIAGAPYYDAGEVDEGAAFVFYGSQFGVEGSLAAATQLESDQVAGNFYWARFGWSVASAGDVNGDGYADVIVGAPGYDAGEGDEGAAFIFHGRASGIPDGNPSTAAARLESNQQEAGTVLVLGAEFQQISAAGVGDVNGDGYADVILGVPGYDAGQSDEGAAFIFHGSAAGVANGNPTTAATQLESNQLEAVLGWSVASAGDVNGDGYADVIVGAPGYTAGQVHEGAAFLFLGGASGVTDGDPATAATQLESNQSAIFGLGFSVAGAGDVNGDGFADVIVGAPDYGPVTIRGGAAFLFHGSAIGVADGNPSTAQTQFESNQAYSGLGFSVAGAGDVNGDGYPDVAVGATGYDAGEANEGALFVFHGSGTGIPNGSPATAATQLESNQASAQFGGSAAGAGDVNGDGYSDVIVGAPSYDAGDPDEGAAFVYHGGADGLRDGNPSTAVIAIQSGLTSGWLGASVASAGDVNGDGYSDMIVGAPRFDALGQIDAGAAFVLHGSATAALIVGQQIDGDQANAEFGGSVAGAGDTNGDGYADVIVGANLYSNGESNEGGAFIFHGTSTGIATNTANEASTRLEGNQAGALLGGSVASAGDVNGDGVGDVIVGAAFYSAGESAEGAAFVFHGAAGTGIPHGGPATAATQLESNQTNTPQFYIVAGAGDANGDGYADVIVGAPAWSNGETQEGGAFVFHGSAAGVADGNPTTAATRIESNQAIGLLGGSVAGAGDVNGDGYADVIVGADFYDSGEGDEGVALVFHGQAPSIAHGSPSTANTILESNQAGGWLGSSVAGVGDVNGDGYADAAVGARGYDAGETDEGAVFVFHGSAIGVDNGDPGTAATQLESNQAGAQFGGSVAGAGDVNGDGYAEVIVGSGLYDVTQTDEGAAFVFLGGGDGDGRPVLARQLRGSSDLPVVPWSRAEATFRVRIEAAHPAGRGRAKIQVEHCPAGVAFGGAGCLSTSPVAWTDVPVGAGGITLTRDIGGMPSNQLRHWRARVLYAPATGTAPLVPAHGPWRRVHAQAVEGDFRTAIVSGGGGGGCGIGPELALLVPALFGLRGLRGRGR